MKRTAYRWVWTKESGRFSTLQIIEVDSGSELIEETVVTSWGEKYEGRLLVARWPEEITVTYFDNGHFYPHLYYPPSIHVAILGIDDFIRNAHKY